MKLISKNYAQKWTTALCSYEFIILSSFRDLGPNRKILKKLGTRSSCLLLRRADLYRKRLLRIKIYKV
jgi:hypothetical protein